MRKVIKLTMLMISITKDLEKENNNKCINKRKGINGIASLIAATKISTDVAIIIKISTSATIITGASIAKLGRDKKKKEELKLVVNIVYFSLGTHTLLSLSAAINEDIPRTPCVAGSETNTGSTAITLVVKATIQAPSTVAEKMPCLIKRALSSSSKGLECGCCIC